MTNPAILVDDRQPTWQFLALERIGFTVTKRRLETADLVWAVPYGTVGVEDKPMKALLTDLRSGRLNDQLERLRAKFTLPVLLLRQDGGDEIPGYHTLRFGRQLRGIVVADALPDFATAVKAYYDYTQAAGRPLRRPYERHYPWVDEMSAPAEVIHTILQQVPRLTDRTRLAMSLAVSHGLLGILSLMPHQWQEIGFSKLQAERLTAVCLKLLNDVPLKLHREERAKRLMEADSDERD